jgi:RNA-directed DNA polymerase
VKYPLCPPVRRKEIDKPDGGVRLLGIPTVLDRLIQQAVGQVLTNIWDHTFSESSFGDKELEKRGLRFVRYADDCVIYVRSAAAAQRVKRSVTTFITRRLRLKVKEEKSAIDRPWKSKYLGFSLTNSRQRPLISIHWKSIKRLKERIREITSRNRGRSLSQVIDELVTYLKGWWGYYGIAESRSRLTGLANWIRRRLRSLQWKHWKNPRTRVRRLLGLGISREYAVTTGAASKGCWRMSQVKWVMIALPNRYFEQLGLVIPWD